MHHGAPLSEWNSGWVVPTRPCNIHDRHGYGEQLHRPGFKFLICL